MSLFLFNYVPLFSTPFMRQNFLFQTAFAIIFTLKRTTWHWTKIAKTFFVKNPQYSPKFGKRGIHLTQAPPYMMCFWIKIWYVNKPVKTACYMDQLNGIFTNESL